jgi:hypothetical protein
MRYYLALTLLVGVLNPASAQNPFEPDSHIACVERLPVPTYPVEAIQTQTEGIITAKVVLSPQASVQLVTTEFRTKTQKTISLLIRAVEDAIREAAFRSTCAGETVALVFDFKLAGQRSDVPKQSASFGYPNKFWIVSEPATPPARPTRP